jgi:hypothetical protein
VSFQQFLLTLFFQPVTAGISSVAQNHDLLTRYYLEFSVELGCDRNTAMTAKWDNFAGTNVRSVGFI